MEQSKFYQIKNITEQEYTLVGCDGSVITRPILDVDKSASAFTIQDAKSGDVLATLDYILIFKECLKKDGGVSYCHYDFGAGNPQFIYTEDNNWYFGKEAMVYPATKEQRDLLFQKMKEAGYEWDAEKKQLKKIEQKPDKNKGMNLVEEDMTPFQKKVFCIVDTAIEEEQGLSNICNELLALALQENQQKPAAWSEKDERMYRGLHNLIYSTPYCDSRKELSDWLKSLKDRVQPKQEWSEEDEEMYKEVLTDIIYAKNDLKVKECLGLSKRAMEAFNWFSKRYKSLRTQNRWKPSDEQMNALDKGRIYIPTTNIERKFIDSLIEDLKKLREE